MHCNDAIYSPLDFRVKSLAENGLGADARNYSPGSQVLAPNGEEFGVRETESFAANHGVARLFENEQMRREPD